MKLKTGAEIDVYDSNIPLWVRVCAWLETLTIRHGSLAGQRFELQPFQIEIVKAICDPQYSSCALTLPRGNGKTALLGAITACAVAGPLAIPNTVIPVVAAEKGQASICVEHALMFLDDYRKADPKRWRVRDNKDLGISIQDIVNNIRVEAVSANPRSKHGGSPALVVADEPAQWMPQAGQKVWNAIHGGLGKQTHSRVVAIGTMPDSPHHFFSKAIASGLTDEGRKQSGTWSMQYSADPDAEYDDVDAVAAANPMWHHIKSLRDVILKEIEAIRLGEGSEASFRAYRMNCGTMETDDVEYLLGANTLDLWEQTCVVPDGEFDIKHPRQGPYFIGIDLGEARSLTAGVIYWWHTGRLEMYAACPVNDQLTLEDREREDSNPGVYKAAVRNGELKLFAGNVTPVDEFLKWLANDVLADAGMPERIFADRYKQAACQQALAGLNNGWHRRAEFRAAGSGPDGVSDVTNFRRECYDNRLKSRPSFLGLAALRDARVKRDNNGNGSINKDRSRGRIDVMQAAVMAVSAGYRARYPDVNAKRGSGIDAYIMRMDA